MKENDKAISHGKGFIAVPYCPLQTSMETDDLMLDVSLSRGVERLTTSVCKKYSYRDESKNQSHVVIDRTGKSY